MLVSILHRATGTAMATAGAMILVWWLFAAASGPDAYAAFIRHATSWYGYVVLIGLTWSFLEHLFSGIRHLVMDIGAGFELGRNKMWAMTLLLAAPALTAAIWAAIFVGAGS